MHGLNEQQQAFVGAEAEEVYLHAGPGSGKTHSLIARVKADQERGARPKGQVVFTYTVKAAEELRRRFDSPSRPWFIGTIHAFSLKVLREQGASLGYDRRCRVMDEDESKEILKQIAERLGVDQRDAEEFRGYELRRTDAQIAARAHLMEMRSRNAVDFRTMQTEATKVLKYKPVVERLYVDEYQDSTDLERKMFDAIECPKVFVGDEDQTIHTWRGASVGIWETTEDRKHCVLERNHRSDARIVGAANAILKGMGASTRIQKHNICVSMEPGCVDGRNANDSRARDEFAIQEALSARMNGETVAILCRYNEDVARLRALWTGDLGSSQYSARDIVGRKREDWCMARSALSVLAGSRSIDEPWFATTGAASYDVALTELWGGWGGCSDVQIQPSKAIRGMRLTPSQVRIAEEMLAGGRSAEEALEASFDEQQAGTDMHIGTIHSAKGAEWDRVIVCGCEDVTWEHATNNGMGDELRRLFYVAITRARHTLTLHWADKVFGSKGVKQAKESQFVKEIIG